MYLDPRCVPINMVSYPMDFRCGASHASVARIIQSTGLVGCSSHGLVGHIHIWLVVSTCEKYESHLGLSFPIKGKIKHVPNHQPDIFVTIYNGGVLYKRGLGILM